MDESENLSEVQVISFELFETYRSKSKARRISDNKFAAVIHLKPVTWSSYINGYRVPNLENALQIGEYIAKYLGDETRSRFLDACGHKMYHRINDPQLKYIVEEWEFLDTNSRNEIFKQVSEMHLKRTETESGT